VLAAFAALGGVSALAQESPQPADPGVQRLDAGGLIAILLDHAAPTAARDDAADRLVVLAQRPEAARAAASLLEAGVAPVEAQNVLLAAIGRAWEVPVRLAHPLLEGVETADAQRLPAWLTAIGAVRTPDAARVLIRFLAPERTPQVRAAAADALARMTGRDDLGDSADRWRDWLERARGLGARQWDDLLAHGVWQRAQRLEVDRHALADRLIDGYRRLYLALPAEPGDERARLLTQMLSGRPELRDLGFEIISREVAGGKSVDGVVADAVLRLLSQPDASVRAKAAAISVQLPSPDHGRRLAQALAAETDPAAAGQMLLGMARWPDPLARPAALRWLESGTDATGPASDALLALLRAGMLSTPADRDRTLAALRRLPAQRLPPSACDLLVRFGAEGDRAEIASLLAGQPGPVRQAAADALAADPSFTQAILDATANDPSLFSAAVGAVAACRPTATGYSALAALAAPSPAEQREGLLRAASLLNAPDLVEVARATSDLQFRAAILSRFIEHSAPAPDSRPASTHDTTMAGILLLAQTYLELKRPDLAAAALDAVPESSDGVDPGQMLRLRTIALLWSNRLDDAAALDAPAAAWLDGLERALGEPHAPAILKALKERFAGRLTPDEADRLKALTSRLAAMRTSADGQSDGRGPG
jgi:hypothetical protein